MFYTKTFGVLPTKQQYDDCWKRTGVGEVFRFGNDPRVGTCDLTQDELWDELKKAHQDYESGQEDAGNFCSCVLSVLGFEWV